MQTHREQPTHFTSSEAKAQRIAQLKSFLNRLNQGEPFDVVQKAFNEVFQTVDPMEIVEAEQALMEAGLDRQVLAKLCDLHAALVRDALNPNGGRAGEAPVEQQQSMPSSQGSQLGQPIQPIQPGHPSQSSQPDQPDHAQQPAPKPQPPFADKQERAAALISQAGHPLQRFHEENQRILRGLSELQKGAAHELNEAWVTAVSIHYAKKGDLLYPLLKTKYGVIGPSEVMWTVDDEIRDDLRALVRMPFEGRDEAWQMKRQDAFKRVEEMAFKESRILFPICAVQLHDEDWLDIDRDAKDYDPVCPEQGPYPTWSKAAPVGVRGEGNPQAESQAEGPAESKANASAPNGTVASDSASLPGLIQMPGGQLTLEQLTALLNTLPIEITFVDDQDINRYFNEGPKLFKRPLMALGRQVYDCHPPKIEARVRQIISGFRKGESDVVTVWMQKAGREQCVQYFAVRDAQGRFLGTLEAVQDMEAAKAHFMKKGEADGGKPQHQG